MAFTIGSIKPPSSPTTKSLYLGGGGIEIERESGRGERGERVWVIEESVTFSVQGRITVNCKHVKLLPVVFGNTYGLTRSGSCSCFHTIYGRKTAKLALHAIHVHPMVFVILWSFILCHICSFKWLPWTYMYATWAAIQLHVLYLNLHVHCPIKFYSSYMYLELFQELRAEQLLPEVIAPLHYHRHKFYDTTKLRTLLTIAKHLHVHAL